MSSRPDTLLSFDRSAFAPGLRVAIAISGGADSTALLCAVHAVNRLPRESLGVGLSAVHVNHGLRGEAADRDQSAVETLCGQLSVPLVVRLVDTRAHAAKFNETLEEAARSLRYGIFSDLIAAGEVDAVATAHTADDQAETVLMKLLRGAWTEGLAGIFPVVDVKSATGRTGRILRPLLATDRAAVEAYLRSINQDWMEDETNADPAFTRNRVRHQLVPMLREFNPSVQTTLGNLAEIAREEELYWQREVDRVMPQVVLPGKPVRGGGRANSTAPDSAVLAIDLERLRAMAPALRRRVLRATARQLGVSLSFAETARLLALSGLSPAMATVPTKPGSHLQLGEGLRAERSLRELRLSRSPGRPAEQQSTA